MTSGRESVDVIVVGAGAVGVACAYYLARRGVAVAVVDEMAGVGSRCSFGNGGVISPSHCLPLATPSALRELPVWLTRGGRGISVKPRLSLALLRFGAAFVRSCRGERMLDGLRCLRDFSRRSKELFEELERDEHLKFGYQARGLMNVCRGRRALEHMLELATLLEREGLEPEVLDGDGARRLEPALSEEVAGAVYWAGDAHCEPHRFVVELSSAAETRGARFWLGTRVDELFRAADGSVTGVRTSRGPIAARTVVVAAGAWSAPLVRSLGIRLPLEPARGYHLEFEGPPGLRMPVIFEEVVAAATPLDGRLRLVGGMEFVGLDSSLDRRRALRLADAARSYLRVLGEHRPEPSSVWCGLRPCAPDGLPIVGWSSRVRNVLLATGHGMLGLTLAPATGLAVTELVTSGRSSLPVGALSPARFRA